MREDVRGQFRMPSLRNVAATPPYMHDGRIDRLQDAVLHGDRAAPPLSAQHVDDLAAFLATLADAYGKRRPWPLAGFVSCP